MYHYSISKVIDEDIDEKEIERRISKIAEEFDLEAFGLEYLSLAWKDSFADGTSKIVWHDAFKISWGDSEPFGDIKVLAYAINKAFKGAQACITMPHIGQYSTGHTRPDEGDE